MLLEKQSEEKQKAVEIREKNKAKLAQDRASKSQKQHNLVKKDAAKKKTKKRWVMPWRRSKKVKTRKSNPKAIAATNKTRKKKIKIQKKRVANAQTNLKTYTNEETKLKEFSKLLKSRYTKTGDTNSASSATTGPRNPPKTKASSPYSVPLDENKKMNDESKKFHEEKPKPLYTKLTGKVLPLAAVVEKLNLVEAKEITDAGEGKLVN